LTLLQKLGPDERAAFLLREVFGCDYAEVARALEKTEAACRQLVHRAHEHVRSDRARSHHVRGAEIEMLPRYLAALRSGDERALLSVLAADAHFVSDGGGKVTAARKPLEGAPRIAHVLAKVQQKLGGGLEHRLAHLNGEAALLGFEGDALRQATFIQTDGQRIFAMYRLLNPEKLARVAGTLRVQG